MRPRRTYRLLVCTLTLIGCATELNTDEPGGLPDAHEELSDPATDELPVEPEPEPEPEQEPVTAPPAVVGAPPEKPALDPTSGEVVPSLPRPWRATSTRIELETRNYWLGGMRYERAVEDLTEEQLTLLQGLQRADTDANFCIYDSLEATVTIFDEDGTSETFELEHGTCYYDGPLLTEDSLRAFLRSLDCLTRSMFGWRQGLRDLPQEDLPTITANDGCTHGVYDSPGRAKLEVSDTEATYTIESLDCEHNETRIELFDAAGETLLASGVEGEPVGCSSLTYRFAEPGSYTLQLDGAGDYFLRVSAE